MRKVGVLDLTIQSSFLQLFEKETWKGKWQEKSWNPRSYHLKFIMAGFEWKTVKGKGNEKSRSPRSYHPKFILAAV